MKLLTLAAALALGIISSAAHAGQKIELLAGYVCNPVPVGTTYAACTFQARQLLAGIAQQCAGAGVYENSPQFGECILGGAQTLSNQALAQQQAQQQVLAQQRAAQAAAAQMAQQRRQACFFAALGQASAPRVGAIVTFGGAMSEALLACQ